MNTIFEGDVPTFAIETVSERVERVNRRAQRRGFPQVTMATGDSKLVRDPYHEHTAFCMPQDCSAREVEYTTVTIAATAPLKMSGWRLLGVIAQDATNTDGSAAVMVTDVPGESTRGINITDAMLCEHCNTRRYRTETFIVKHDDNRIMQVGRQCIRDFLGHDPAALLAGLDAFRSLMLSDSERESWGRAAPREYAVKDVVYAASRIVAAEGWYISKAKAIESEYSDRPLTSTAARVYGVLEPATRKELEHNDSDYPANDAAQALCDATMEALTNVNPSKSEWEYKLSTYANIKSVGTRHFGILASATILGLRAQERPRVEKAAKRISKHIGNVGDKVTVNATVEFVRMFDGNYGTTTIVKFSANDGDIVWFQSGAHEQEWTIGDSVTLTGTVKKHDIDKYTNQPVTALTRCKVGAA